MTDRNSETITLGHEYTTYSWGWWTTPPRSIVVNALVPVRPKRRSRLSRLLAILRDPRETGG